VASIAGFFPGSAPDGVVAGPCLSGFTLEDVPWLDMTGEMPAWDALAQCASEPNPFFESWYLLPGLMAFDPLGEVRLLRFMAGAELAGLLPVVRPRRYYRWPIPNVSSWLHANCFLGAPMVAAGLEREFWLALLAWADRSAGPGLFLHLGHMPLSGPLHAALTEVLCQQHRTAALVWREERARLSSHETPEAYFEAALSSKQRKELRRQLARLSELGDLCFERRNDAVGIEEWIDRFLALEAAGPKGAAGSSLAANPATTYLFRESLLGAAARRRLQRLTLSLNDEPIAMLATFLTPPGAFSFKTAVDERYARFSPGLLLQREYLAILERGDITWTDSCAAADHPMIDQVWRERRPIGRLTIAIGGTLRRALFAGLVRAELRRKPRPPRG
jgi:CelD/BcsL family acetyltransferase involved in cellulose biosynthesis